MVPAFLPPGLFPGLLWVLVYLGGVVEPLLGALPAYPLPRVLDQPPPEAYLVWPGDRFAPELDHLVPPPPEPVCVACDELGGGELPLVAALACSTELSASATVPASTAMPASERGPRGLRPISRLPCSGGAGGEGVSARYHHVGTG